MKSLCYYIVGCLIITIGGGISMLGISTADMAVIEPVLSASLIAGSPSGIIHSVIGFSFAGTLAVAVLSHLHKILRNRKKSR